MSSIQSRPLVLHRRSKRWLILAGLVLLIGGVLFWKFVLSNASLEPSTPSFNNTVLPVALAGETKQSPWRLDIPNIKLDTAIQEVGLTKDGNMGVPSNYTDVGWLKTGPRPGEPGNSVFAGHLNGGANKPGVFANLHKLKPGDLMYVKDKTKNEEQAFRVTSSESYDVAKAPLEKIFGATQGSHLNLITCSGKWDKTKKDYNQRLVVFSELIQT